MQTLIVKTGRRTQLVDVTAQVQKVVASSGVAAGICYLYVPHTTAAITINECADPDVARDVEGAAFFVSVDSRRFIAPELCSIGQLPGTKSATKVPT